MTPSLGGLPTKAKESHLPMRQTIPRRTPTRNFIVSGGANRYYTLLKGDLEVVAAKGNLIIPRRNSTTGCSLMSYPGHLLLLLLLLLFLLQVSSRYAYCKQGFLSSIHLIVSIFSIVEQVNIVCPLGPGQTTRFFTRFVLRQIIEGKFEPFGHLVV